MTYCISDIHGCYTEFLALLEMIDFSMADTLYVLGDMIDRGEASLEVLQHIYAQPNMHALMGNHEMMMLDYFATPGKPHNFDWLANGGGELLRHINALEQTPEGNAEWQELWAWVKSLPLYHEITVNGTDYFLSHAGFNTAKPLDQQTPHDYVWSRDAFIPFPALKGKICIFGHTPTPSIRRNSDHTIWTDPIHHDKTGIDCGCVYGGALAALRLDDGEVFYITEA